jgi:hypothetical protein
LRRAHCVTDPQYCECRHNGTKTDDSHARTPINPSSWRRSLSMHRGYITCFQATTTRVLRVPGSAQCAGRVPDSTGRATRARRSTSAKTKKRTQARHSIAFEGAGVAFRALDKSDRQIPIFSVRGYRRASGRPSSRLRAPRAHRAAGQWPPATAQEAVRTRGPDSRRTSSR